MRSMRFRGVILSMHEESSKRQIFDRHNFHHLELSVQIEYDVARESLSDT